MLLLVVTMVFPLFGSEGNMAGRAGAESAAQRERNVVCPVGVVQDDEKPVMLPVMSENGVRWNLTDPSTLQEPGMLRVYTQFLEEARGSQQVNSNEATSVLITLVAALVKLNGTLQQRVTELEQELYVLRAEDIGSWC